MFGTGKTRLTELLYAEESMICEAISIQYWSVTDRQTHRQTEGWT